MGAIEMFNVDDIGNDVDIFLKNGERLNVRVNAVKGPLVIVGPRKDIKKMQKWELIYIHQENIMYYKNVKYSFLQEK